MRQFFVWYDGLGSNQASAVPFCLFLVGVVFAFGFWPEMKWMAAMIIALALSFAIYLLARRDDQVLARKNERKEQQ